MDPSRISLEDDRRGLSGLAFRFGNRATYRGLDAGQHVWRVEIFVAPADELQLVEVDEQGNKSSRQPAPGEMFDALELLSEPGQQTYAALAALVLTGVELRAAGEAAQAELGALLRAAAEDTAEPMPLRLPGDERPLHLSQQGRQVLRQLADSLLRDGRAMATLPAVRRLQVSPDLVDALHKRVRRQHLQAYRTGDHWFVVLENLPKAPEDESPLLARAEEPPAPANEQPSGSSNGYHRDDTGAPGASPATEEPQPASPAAETAVLEPTASAEAEAPPAAESVTAAQPEETAAQGTAFEEPPAAQEQPASEAPVAEAAVPEEQAAAEGQLAPEERLATQERPAEEEQAGVAEQSVAEDEAVAVATEQTAAGEEQDQEQELVAVGVVAVAHEQFAAAGEAPAGGAAAGEAPSGSAAAEAPAREAAGETEATEEPAAGPEPAPEAEAATPVSSHQLFDALSAGGPAEAEVLQQLRAEIAFLRQQMREKDRQIAAWITESRRKDLSVTRLENRLRVVPGERGRARTETELSNASTSDLLAAREQLMAPLAERLYQLEDRLGRLEARRTARQPTPWYRRLIGSGSDPQNVT